jgi:hypothetical protein
VRGVQEKAPVTLAPLPPAFAATRALLHRAAQDVLSPARERVTGRIGLRATPGGFGTPPFGDGEEVRIEGAELVHQTRAGERRERLEDVDDAAARALGTWYAFGDSLLEELRAEADAARDTPSIVQLWPEHFDIAIEMGDEQRAARANYGFSPGDEGHPEPYAYVGPWAADRARGPLWNARGFAGAELSYSELLAAGDQRRTALQFLRERRDFLRG